METQGRRGPERSDDEIAAELVRRLKGGDPGAFLEFYDLCAPSLYAYLYLLLGERYGAAQATQDALELGFDLLPEESPVPIRVWLFWVAQRRAGATRTGYRDFGLDSDERDPLVSAILRLPAGAREAVVLRHLFGFTAAEAGVVLDRSPRSISSLESRGLDQLGRRLPDETRPVPPERVGLRIRPRESPVAYGRRWALAPS